MKILLFLLLLAAFVLFGFFKERATIFAKALDQYPFVEIYKKNNTIYKERELSRQMWLNIFGCVGALLLASAFAYLLAVI